MFGKTKENYEFTINALILHCMLEKMSVLHMYTLTEFTTKQPWAWGNQTANTNELIDFLLKYTPAL